MTARRLLLTWLVFATLACGGDSGTVEAAPAAADRGPSWDERLSEPTVSIVLEALAQSHRHTRTALGPHRLSYQATFDLVEADEPARPKVGSPAPRPQHTTDELVLEWASTADAAPAFRLQQNNDHERGREVVLTGDRLYTRQRHRNWLSVPLESTIHELWLDDAQRCVHDIVELAAPFLTIEATAGTAADGRATVALTLGLALKRDSSRSATGRGQAWRNDAEISSISGEITLDQASGVWLSADVSLRYSLDASSGRAVRGELDLVATLEPVDQLTISAPGDAQPVPERRRQEVERHQLLDGLAAQ